jgi:uncharacterized protein (TIGR03382 family)
MNRLLLVVAALLPGFASAQLVFPGGNVPAGSTWGLPGISQTVTLNGDVTIPVGVTLTVLPGTVITAAATDAVMRSGGTSLVDIFVEGTLIVQEAAGQPAIFRGPGTATNTWGGFIVSSGATVQAGGAQFQRMSQGLRFGGTTLTLNNVIVSSSSACVSVSAGTATIAGSTFSGCGGNGLSVSGGTVNVSSSVLRDNGSSGVDASGGTTTIDRSTIAFNSSFGVLGNCGSPTSLSVTNSIVSHNSSQGVRRYSFCTSPSVSVADTIVWGNNGTSAASPATAGANTASNNYESVSYASSNQSANPLFVDGPTRNLRLTHRSVARRPSATDLGALPFTGDQTAGGLQGFIWANEAFSGAVSVVGDVTIPSGVTVTVNPGATFTFASSDTQGSGLAPTAAELFVTGSLQAIGTASSQIVFSSTGASASWGGPRIAGSASIAQARFERMSSFTSSGTLTVSNATIGPATGCLSLSSGTHTISGSTFSGCGGNGLSVSGGIVNVSSSVLRDNGSSGVDASGGTTTIDRSTIAFNSSFGVLGNCGSPTSLSVTNSIVSHNSSQGVRRYSFCTSPSVSVAYSDVWGNNGTGNAQPPTGANTASNNYESVSYASTNQSANPLFTNATGMPRDLTLTSTSPSIGAGRVGAVAGGAVIDQGAFPFMVGPVATIIVTPVNPSVAAGATQAFTATALDSNNNPVATTITWSTTAGTITTAGLLTATCTPGTITNGVSATAPNGVVGRTNVTVVLGSPNNVAITPTAPTVKSQGTQQFTAAVRDSCNNPLPGASITWSASAQAGTITSTGLFTASCSRGPWSNAITATSGAISGRTDVTVGPGDVAAVSLTPMSPTVPAGTTQLFAATAADGCGNTVMNAPITWSTTAPGASITSTGIFSAGQSNGTFANAVTASTPGASGPVSGSTGVTITGGSGSTVSSITISPMSTTLATGGTQQFTATALNASGQAVSGAPITWSIVNGGGTISQTGLFTAGTTAGAFAGTVRAASGSVSATASVTITPGPVATVSVSPMTATLAPGGSTTFTAQPRDANGNAVTATVTWTATSAAGTITSGGVFTASNTPGTYAAGVTATVGNVSGNATVTIQTGALASLTVMPTLAMVQAGATAAFTVVGRDGSGTQVPVTPTWSVVSGGGTINAAGIFTAGTMAGTFGNTVRVEANGLAAFASVRVSPGPVIAVTVSPGSATVMAGGTQAFTAEARDAFNNVVPIGVAWTSQPAAGTINAGGLFTAGSTPGTFSNAITANASGVDGFASVTVTGGAGGGMAGGSAGGMAGGAAGGMAGGSAGGMAGGAAGGMAGGAAAGGDAGGSSNFGGGFTGLGGGTAGGGGAMTPPPSGCGCSSPAGMAPLTLLAFALLQRRRRRTSRWNS